MKVSDWSRWLVLNSTYVGLGFGFFFGALLWIFLCMGLSNPMLLGGCLIASTIIPFLIFLMTSFYILIFFSKTWADFFQILFLCIFFIIALIFGIRCLDIKNVIPKIRNCLLNEASDKLSDVLSDNMNKVSGNLQRDIGSNMNEVSGNLQQHMAYAPAQVPYAPTQVPVAPTQVPYAPTQVPYAPTQVPVAPAQVPVAPTQVPVAST